MPDVLQAWAGVFSQEGGENSQRIPANETLKDSGCIQFQHANLGTVYQNQDTPVGIAQREPSVVALNYFSGRCKAIVFPTPVLAAK